MNKATYVFVYSFYCQEKDYLQTVLRIQTVYAIIDFYISYILKHESS